MSKKMRTPEKMPPAASAVNGANAPVLEITDIAQAASATEFAAPTKNPPALSAETEGFGAAVWSSDKRVNALYNTYHARNSWMGIAGVGWKKLATGSDSMCEAMTVLAAHCREKNCRIDYAEENGTIKEIYVW
jgi:hypothetical protein